MTRTHAFHIGDVIAAMTGKMVSPRHIAGIRDVLTWMTGEEPETHQIPRFGRECEAALRVQFPRLATVQVPTGLDSRDKVMDWLASLYPEHGETVDVQPLAEVDHTTIDPIAELRMMRPDAAILSVGGDHG